mgnify:FL=1
MKGYKKYNNKNYDETNKYDFYTKKFLQYGVGTKYEGIIELNKEQYKKINERLKDNPNTNLRLFKTYSVGFYGESGAYIIQNVDKDVFQCLFKTQRYEKNKIKHERDRHLNTFFEQKDIDKLVSKDNVEDLILNKIEDEKLREYLNSILSEKQSRRFYKNKIEEIPLLVIACEEDKNVAAVKRSVDRAVRKILGAYKNNKKF